MPKPVDINDVLSFVLERDERRQPGIGSADADDVRRAKDELLAYLGLEDDYRYDEETQTLSPVAEESAS